MALISLNKYAVGTIAALIFLLVLGFAVLQIVADVRAEDDDSSTSAYPSNLAGDCLALIAIALFGVWFLFTDTFSNVTDMGFIATIVLAHLLLAGWASVNIVVDVYAEDEKDVRELNKWAGGLGVSGIVVGASVLLLALVQA